MRGRKAVKEAEDNRRREVHYCGLVQGVGFRYTVRRIACRFRVTGYVRNLPDGRVHLVAEGPSEELDGFLASVRTAMDRYIDRADQIAGPATGQFRHFEIRF